jgi:hypothetical protein
MDCKTARLLLEFAHPGQNELPESDLALLEAHLTGCADCRETAQAERGFDQALAKAMRQVEVPDRLRNHLLHRLESQCNDQARRRWGRAIRALAAAAVLLLGVWAALQWWHEKPTPVAVDSIGDAMVPVAFGFEPQQVEEHFQHLMKLKNPINVPRDLNYGYLADMRLADFQGKQVPELLFVNGDKGWHARVFLLLNQQFDLRTIPPGGFTDDRSRCKVEVRFNEGDSCAYVIAYTGDDLSWLAAAGATPL